MCLGLAFERVEVGVLGKGRGAATRSEGEKGHSWGRGREREPAAPKRKSCSQNPGFYFWTPAYPSSELLPS